jgi:hypothetical protein
VAHIEPAALIIVSGITGSGPHAIQNFATKPFKNLQVDSIGLLFAKLTEIIDHFAGNKHRQFLALPLNGEWNAFPEHHCRGRANNVRPVINQPHTRPTIRASRHESGPEIIEGVPNFASCFRIWWPFLPLDLAERGEADTGFGG